ncbi:hypothetical protein Tco_1258050 [Tanacetum coccineum]
MGHFVRDCYSKTSVPSYQSPFQPKLLKPPHHKPELRPTKDFEAKYNKIKAKLAFLSLNASASKASMVKNNGLVAESYEWDVSSDDNEVVEVKVLMALANDENAAVGKDSARNGEWVKIAKERNNLVLKHKNLVHELNTCKEQLLVLKQAKHDFLTMQHVNTKILKENKNLRVELKELIAITESWLNSSNKVNQCISEDINVSIPGVERRWLSVAEGSILPNHDSKRILSAETQTNTTDSPAVNHSSETDESLVCNDSHSPLEKLGGAEPVSGPKTVKSILRSNFTSKNKVLKGVTLKEPQSTPTKSKVSASKANSNPARKLKEIKIEDDPPLAAIMKEFNDLKIQFSKRLKVVFGDDPTCTTKGYGSIKCNGIVFTKVAFANGLKYNLVSISKLCDAKYIVQFDEKKGTIFNSNKEVVMIAPRLPPDEYLHPYEPSQKHHVTTNNAPFIDPYENPEPDTNQLSDQIDQNDNPLQNDEILNDDQTAHSTQDNDNIIETSLPMSLVRTLIHLQKLKKLQGHAKELGAASAHECLFVDFLLETEPKKFLKLYSTLDG